MSRVTRKRSYDTLNLDCSCFVDYFFLLRSPYDPKIPIYSHGWKRRKVLRELKQRFATPYINKLPKELVLEISDYLTVFEIDNWVEACPVLDAAALTGRSMENLIYRRS